MPIQVKCATCGGLFNAPDNALGKTARCPTCNGPVEIKESPVAEIVEAEDTFAAVPAKTADDGATLADARRPCPMCGEMIQRDAIKCRFCGEIFDPALARAGAMRKGSYDFGPQSAEMQQDKSTAILLFATSLLGCFSPILGIYGIVFLSKRPHHFPYKGLAIAGTIIHCIYCIPWLLFFIGLFASAISGR